MKARFSSPFLFAGCGILVLLACVSSCSNPPKPKLPNLPGFPGKKETETATVDFDRQIRPLLQHRCLPCHNSNRAARDLNLETYESANNSWGGGVTIVPGNAERSMLYQVTLLQGDVSAHDLGLAERNLIRTWINEGARWPHDVRLQPGGSVQP